MKRLHRSNLFGWSVFDELRNIDFNSVVWVRDQGNVVIDPLPMSEHDRRHLSELGGAALIVITNSDHVRDAVALAADTSATIVGPAGERGEFPVSCQRWVGDGDEIAPGLRALAMQGSKTRGELALVIEGHTIVTGDLVRAHEGGRLCLLPDGKLSDKQDAVRSLHRLTAVPGIDAVLPGDGWPVFRDGGAALTALLRELS